MKYKLYTTSQKAWDGMFKTMARAEKSIYMEMYIFLDDTQATHNFLGLLEDKAKAGVEVVVIADSYGSASLHGTAVAALKAAGVEFIFFSHWLRHTHRKILIVDKKVAFIGGVNIKEKIRHWHDLQIKLEGKIIMPMLKSFAYSYQIMGGKKEAILKYSRLPLVKKIKAWITDSIVGSSRLYDLNNYYKERIGAAKTSIKIVTPYLLPPRWLLVILDDACRRGVNVEIIIPNDTDIKPLNKINYLNSCRLGALGVKFYLMPAMNHAKIMLIDDEEGLIGSQNMDVLSFNLNMEAGVFFRQKDLVNDLKNVFTHWRQESIFFNSADKKIKWYDRILIGFFKLFYPIF
ncbi:MAG: phosphatidylserine/phosphatidylglycerophosphate/cardiolipin synthase family protein [Patescibacteria group bacterium]